MTIDNTCATTGAGAAVPASIYLDLLTCRTIGHPAITTRSRWPVPFQDESLAVAQAIALLHQHPEIAGFIVLSGDMQAANDAYLNERTITRATMARKARQRRKQAEANHANS